jgi:hypothetical protein
MKEQELIKMRNQIETLGSVLQNIVQELDYMRNLSVGTMELVKQMPDYQAAMDSLVEKTKKAISGDEVE